MKATTKTPAYTKPASSDNGRTIILATGSQVELAVKAKAAAEKKEASAAPVFLMG